VAALGAAALLGPLPAWATAAEMASTLCAACHGEGGNSVVPTFPKLAGLQADYLAKQLNDFLTGRRTSDVMMPAIPTVKPGDAPALAAYYASQKPAPGTVVDPALAAAGKKLYDAGNDATGVAACSGCHLPKGEGDARNPRLAGQHQAYAIQQMMDFKTGARKNDKARVMRVIAGRMTEAEIKAVAEYLAAP
jgi:cytochrome c553